MSLVIKYGTQANNIDVTKIALEKCSNNNIIFISRCGNERNLIFTDPSHGKQKKIFIRLNKVNYEFDNRLNIYIDTLNKLVFSDTNVPNSIQNMFVCSMEPTIRHFRLKNQLKIDFGNFDEELPEQLMACKYLTGNEKVLEIGGNIGRNSLIIGSILNSKNNDNFVVLECNSDSYNKLIHNRDINNLKFNIFNGALSKRNLIQIGWDTMVSDVILEGWSPVNTITFEDLSNKFNINFDTLIIDCEGAFYYILLDMPEILNNANLIIIENDYRTYEHKICMDNILKKNNFYVHYSEAGGWGDFYNNFYEVWKKK